MKRIFWLLGITAVVAAIVYYKTGTPPANPAPAESAGDRAGAVDQNRIAAANAEPGQWLAHGRTYAEQRYSPLDRITDGNVERLGLVWYADLPTRRGVEATPIVVDGVLYTTGAWSIVYAYDAATGELLWQWDPEVPKEWARHACCDVVNRGPAVWKGKVFVGTLDGRLAALDAGTGEPVWIIRTTPADKPYTITGAPRVFGDKVVIGNGGAEFGVRGYVTAYDTKTGEQVWRFYTVPGNPADPPESKAMEMALPTWSGDVWWEYGGGGTAWDSFAYDPELDLLYIGVGNAGPWPQDLRSPGGGDNLFASSIVAVRGATGQYVWHYQTTPGDNWDYTATQHMILATLRIGDTPRKVLMQAPKNGFFYVLDRETGELLSAENYVPVNWASHVDMETGRPVETGKGRYGEDVSLVTPSPLGGHNWHPMSYNPRTGLVYIPALIGQFPYSRMADFEYDPETVNLGVDLANTAPPDSVEGIEHMKDAMSGHLLAWDPVKQREAWKVIHAGPYNGGTLTTAGNLVFQGTSDGFFNAFRASDGAMLWRTPAQTGIVAAPISFSIGDRQYIAVMAGWGGASGVLGSEFIGKLEPRNISRVLVYALDGDTRLPPLDAEPDYPAPPPLTADKGVIDRGRVVYHRHCSRCHGGGAVSGGVTADLRRMQPGTHEIFADIVLDGLLEGQGMPGFGNQLDEADVEAIRHYVIMRAHVTRRAGLP